MNTPVQSLPTSSKTAASTSRKRLRDTTTSPKQASKRHHPDLQLDKENSSLIERKRRSRSMDSAIDRKFVLRKSTDLRRFKSIDEKVEAIINSPMIEVRKKKSPLERLSQSFSDSETHHRDVSTHIEDIKFSRKSISFFMERSLNFIQNEQSFNQSSSLNDSGLISPPIRRKSLRVPPNTPVVLPSSATPSSSQPDIFPAPDEEELVRHCQLALYKEWNSLKSIIVDWNAILKEEGSALPDRASGDISCTIGMANLLLQKKFPFFDKLIQLALGETPDEKDPDLPPSKPSIEDLRGYWGIVLPEVEKINSAFERLAKWRELKWVEVNRPDTPRPSKSATNSKQTIKNVAPPARKTKLATQLAKSRFAAFKATKQKEMGAASSLATGEEEMPRLRSRTNLTPASSSTPARSTPANATRKTRSKCVSFTSPSTANVTPKQESGHTTRYRKTPPK